MNKQTKFLKKQGWSLKVNKGVAVDNQNRDQNHFTIFETEKPPCVSKRKTSWKGCKSERGEVIYPAEFKNHAKGK